MFAKTEKVNSVKQAERGCFWQLGKGWGSYTMSEEFSAVRSILNNNTFDLCVDIGANEGEYTQEIINNYPHSEVAVFEPAEKLAERLRGRFDNLPNVTVEQFAVSTEEGSAVLYGNATNTGLSSLTKRRLEHKGIDFSKEEIVQTIKFEDYWRHVLDSQHIDFCKIDVEGHELDVLEGFGEAINHVSAIQFEFGGCNIDTRTFFQDFWYFFRKHNFEIYRISPMGLIHITQYSELDEIFTTTNYIAKRSV